MGLFQRLDGKEVEGVRLEKRARGLVFRWWLGGERETTGLVWRLAGDDSAVVAGDDIWSELMEVAEWRERENRRDGWPLSNGAGEREEEGREVGVNGVVGERVVGEAEKMRGPAMLLRRR
ncbi:hypothetical protein HAX54_039979 [Datura stramonium]|uniref:Uncharacterized protein n=1 Tax=Datura stramonium TaxID=4076 RepID=A0ABS8RN30_DATST|nr:hypothetical protein [Datura stramonium]